MVVEDVVHASSLAEKERGQERELNNWFIGLVNFLELDGMMFADSNLSFGPEILV